MAFKIKFKSTLASFIPNINKKFTKEMKRIMADEIAATIISGTSPVTGKRFKGYSTAYARIKGRKQPVDMLVSGDMLNSLTVVSAGPNTVDIFFKDVLALFHTNGDGNLPVRKLLPIKSGEDFSKAIQKRINKAINKIVSQEVKRQNK